MYAENQPISASPNAAKPSLVDELCGENSSWSVWRKRRCLHQGLTVLVHAHAANSPLVRVT